MNRRNFIQTAGLAVAAGRFFSESTYALEAPPVNPTPSQLAYLTDPIFHEHDTGADHPESIARIKTVDSAMKKFKDNPQLKALHPQPADLAVIEYCHEKSYMDKARDEIKAGVHKLSTGDTNVSAKSYDAAVMAVGAICGGVDAVMNGTSKTAFCAVRPPGHHASAAKGMGFCVFNNIAVGARYAQKKHKLPRVAILDWDVHHGNGTQDIFYEDGSVFFFSTHQSPWYPGTGAENETGFGAGKGMTLNCPFPAESGHKQIFGAFKEKLAPALKEFKPDLIMLSAGFDSRKDDPLGRFLLSDDDFKELTVFSMELAKEYAQGRLVSVLEGGYNLSGLKHAVEAHVSTLLKGV